MSTALAELIEVPEGAASPASAVLESLKSRYAPPPRFKVSEFCDAELIVPIGLLEGTRWRTDFAPYQRGMLDVFHEPGVETVVIMGSAQFGKTSLLLNWVAYHIAHDPCPILVVEPTEDPMAKDFSKNRLDQLIAKCKVLRDRVGKSTRGRKATNTVLMKNFDGGLLSIAGANSAASLASRPVRLLLLDEIDRYPTHLKGEGDPISIARARTKTYRGRRRIALVSSPTMVDGPIHAWFQDGDQRHYHVPCPECGTMHRYEWSNVRWKDNDPSTARLRCPECKHGIDDAQRVAQLEFGEWQADNPGRSDERIVSFHVWEAYSPFSSLADIVAGFIKARAKQKAGDPSEMHTWQNTTLGEPRAIDEGEGVDPHVLLARREEYTSSAPAGVCCITMGVDTQDDRLEALVVGWGPGEESWILDRHTLPGDTTQPEPWEMLDELLERTYLHESGQRLPIAATCQDSAGHRTTIVYEYCFQKAARRLFATIGRDGPRPLVSSPSPPRKRGLGRRRCPLYTIGVDTAKSVFMSRLKLTKAGPGFVHLPVKEWADEELCAQLTSEVIVHRWHRGFQKDQWVKIRARNEMLDCVVLAHAALKLLNPDLDALAQQLSDPAKQTPARGGQGAAPWIPPQRGGGWLSRR